MTSERLNEILKNHKKWLNNDNGGECANLTRADLGYANLTRANLRGADLRSANLRNANLGYANLGYANLRGANLRSADLRGADLGYANLTRANLRGADLRGADLRYANLGYANLGYANLRGANLDYSCFPLWCGSLLANFDDRQLKQIAYHLVRAGLNSKNSSEETKAELSKLIHFANGFHRVGECGKIEV